MTLLDLVANATQFSRNQSKRLILQGAVKIDNIKYTDPFIEIEIGDNNEDMSNKCS